MCEMNWVHEYLINALEWSTSPTAYLLVYLCDVMCLILHSTQL